MLEYDLIPLSGVGGTLATTYYILYNLCICSGLISAKQLRYKERYAARKNNVSASKLYCSDPLQNSPFRSLFGDILSCINIGLTYLNKCRKNLSKT